MNSTLGVALFLVIVAGMFAQVMTSSYQERRELLAISAPISSTRCSFRRSFTTRSGELLSETRRASSLSTPRFSTGTSGEA